MSFGCLCDKCEMFQAPISSENAPVSSNSAEESAMTLLVTVYFVSLLLYCSWFFEGSAHALLHYRHQAEAISAETTEEIRTHTIPEVNVSSSNGRVLDVEYHCISFVTDDTLSFPM